MQDNTLLGFAITCRLDATGTAPGGRVPSASVSLGAAEASVSDALDEAGPLEETSSVVVAVVVGGATGGFGCGLTVGFGCGVGFTFDPGVTGLGVVGLGVTTVGLVDCVVVSLVAGTAPEF
jgi:hypothetical protein